MYKLKRLLKSIFRLVLPVVILVVVACVSASIWLVQKASRVEPVPYLVTPAKYGLLSARGAQVTEEKWTNKDGTSARGWLLRGSNSAPAVVLLHKFGADRSYELDLGVKLNEATNFTVLMPDLRGHGESPVVDVSAFGGHESDDTLAAVDFLRNLKTPEGVPLVGARSACTASSWAASQHSVPLSRIRRSQLLLDSVPVDSTAVIADAVERRFPFGSSVTRELARLGARLYFYNGSFENLSPCDAAKAISSRKIMLLSGFDVPDSRHRPQNLAGASKTGRTSRPNTTSAPPATTSSPRLSKNPRIMNSVSSTFSGSALLAKGLVSWSYARWSVRPYGSRRLSSILFTA